MPFTEEDEQRVYEEINRAVAKEMRSPSRLPQDEFMRHIARVALEAMEREPLEDVLDGFVVRDMFRSGNGKMVATVRGRFVGTNHEAHGMGTGLTVDEAIHNAVAAAQEER